MDTHRGAMFATYFTTKYPEKELILTGPGYLTN